ncbi:sulfatase-like protein [Streptomyces sp. SLBN-118]|uniref:sulfatase-like hydrolase/transferase n=1 Tax=Streptomyces sp. SLBN-118 TaxID=2768454 RepID=UPI00116F3AD3|nr:sulfatase-like hydrolase/transferase [Streptomyces sp. SLBN-118]TQK42775.1 sulfatase-like protein [Streptomyces sp. SLBN-118]
MSLFTRSVQLPHSDQAPTEEGPAPDGPWEGTPDDTAAGRDSTAGDATGDDPDAAAAIGWRDRHPAAVRAVAWTTTALAAVLVFFALLMPQDAARLTPSTFVRIPVEGIFGAAVLLVLPPRARRAAAAVAGAVLGVLTLLNFLDMGFHEVFGRGFNLVLDWILLDDGESFLQDSIGRSGAIGVVVVVVILVLALLVLMTLAVVRLSNLMARHSAVAIPTTLVLGTAWITCAALGLQLAGAPVASRNTTALARNRVDLVNATLRDEKAFAKEAAVDAFGDTPPDQLLTGLRGKDVIFTFIESYGRSAVEDPEMAPRVDAALADGTKRLRAAGYSARSGWLTSPTYGGGSWLAHSTFASGLWIDNQQRYRTITAGDHLTLPSAFRKTGAWRTVGIMPGVTKNWPEGKFYGFDKVYDSRHLGYEGPEFSWSTMPDQYALKAFERLEHGKKHDKPLMSEIILTSSHNPWAPLPKTLDWDAVGDGSEYDAIEKAGKDPVDVWKDTGELRGEYAKSIEYSLNSLTSYVEKYGNKNTVLVFLGDHQPVAKVSGKHASRDIPIAIVAHDPAVLDRISGWGWQDGLKPAPKGPVWKMDTFRDRFLKAYGPAPGATPSPSAP